MLQLEYHPLLQRAELRSFCERHGVLLQANALSLQLDGVHHRIRYSGPHDASPLAGEWMMAADRMEEVTVHLCQTRDGGSAHEMPRHP